MGFVIQILGHVNVILVSKENIVIIQFALINALETVYAQMMDANVMKAGNQLIVARKLVL